MAFEQKRDFQISGVVTKANVSHKGGAAFVTVESTRERRTVRHDCKAFDADMIRVIGTLGAGMTVEVIGSIGVEKLTNKDKSEVKHNGFTAWVPCLIVTSVQVEGSSVSADTQKEQERPDVDDIPF